VAYVRGVVNERERALARRMLDGDERAFDEFFRGSFPAVYRFALARTGRDADAAEEVAQATLCRAVAKLSTYRGEASLLTWLCTFCRHEISAYYERMGRTPVPLSAAEPDAESRAAIESLWVHAEDGPEDAFRRGEVAGFVHVVLDALPSRYADALEWKYVDGMSVKEIASRLGLSAKAAESLLTRARVAFREAFETMRPLPGPQRGTA
jgi:RNA polymerase sigma-70 factor (ECF subfamily)